MMRLVAVDGNSCLTIRAFSVGQTEDFVGGFDSHQQLDSQSKKHSVWDITASMR